jgi:hypothetical protein
MRKYSRSLDGSSRFEFYVRSTVMSSNGHAIAEITTSQLKNAWQREKQKHLWLDWIFQFSIKIDILRR